MEIYFPREEVKEKFILLKSFRKSDPSINHKSESENSPTHRNYSNLQNFSKKSATP